MTKTHYWLGGLLATQLLLAAVIFWAGGPSRSDTRQGPLFEFQTDAIDRIVLSDSEHSITLSKKDGRWQLPEFEQLPAQQRKIDDLLTTLASFAPNWPVATTAASRPRFEVADDKFQRRVQLYSGESLAGEALLGTSPGFRKTHIRKTGDDAIYTIALNNFELPVKSDGWLDKSLLKAADVKRVKGEDFVLEQAEGVWRFASGEEAPADELDQDKALGLVTALENLQINEIAEQPPEKEGKTIEVTDKNGDWTYRFIQDGDNHFVSRSDQNKAFTISRFEFDRIAAIGLELLIKEKQEPGDRQEPAQ